MQLDFIIIRELDIDRMNLKYKDWDNISINTYYKIVDIAEDDALCEAEKDIATIAVLCDVDEEDVYDLTIPEAQRLKSQILFLNDFSFNEEIKYKTLKLNGNEYIIDADLSKMNMSQYIDFQTYWQRNDLRTYYGNILACFIIPKGKKYNTGYDVVKLAEELRDTISIKVANEVCFFFIKELLYSIKGTQIYLEWMMKKMKKRNPQMEKELNQLIELNKKRTELIFGFQQLMTFPLQPENPSV